MAKKQILAQSFAKETSVELNKLANMTSLLAIGAEELKDTWMLKKLAILQDLILEELTTRNYFQNIYEQNHITHQKNYF